MCLYRFYNFRRNHSKTLIAKALASQDYFHLPILAAVIIRVVSRVQILLESGLVTNSSVLFHVHAFSVVPMNRIGLLEQEYFDDGPHHCSIHQIAKVNESTSSQSTFEH